MRSHFFTAKSFPFPTYSYFLLHRFNATIYIIFVAFCCTFTISYREIWRQVLNFPSLRLRRNKIKSNRIEFCIKTSISKRCRRRWEMQIILLLLLRLSVDYLALLCSAERLNNCVSLLSCVNRIFNINYSCLTATNLSNYCTAVICQPGIVIEYHHHIPRFVM